VARKNNWRNYGKEKHSEQQLWLVMRKEGGLELSGFFCPLRNRATAINRADKARLCSLRPTSPPADESAANRANGALSITSDSVLGVLDPGI
jgi:hypothetical protein